MVNNLVFRWPKPLFFMVLGAHGILVSGRVLRNSRSYVCRYQLDGPIFELKHDPQDPWELMGMVYLLT